MSGDGTITIRVPLTIRPRPGRKTVVTPDGMSAATRRTANTRGDPAMVKALARAHRWNRMLENGRFASISELAAAEKIDRGYVGTILRLTLLAPDIIEAILDGGHPPDLGLPALLRPFPLEWERQRKCLSIDPEPVRTSQSRSSQSRTGEDPAVIRKATGGDPA